MRRRPKTRSGNLPRMPLFLRYGLLFMGGPVTPSQANAAELGRQAVRMPPPASSGVSSRSCLRRPRERRAGHGRWTCVARPRHSVVPSAQSACHSVASSGRTVGQCGSRHREGALPDASSAATGPSRTTILDAIDTLDEVAHEIPSRRQSSFMSTSCISKTV